MRLPRLTCESLEVRDVPSAVVDTFDNSQYPYAPGGWQQWASNHSHYYSVSRSASLSGSQSVGIYGTLNVESRLWKSESVSGDVTLSLAVRANTPAPLLLFGRGANLNSHAANYQGIVIGTGGAVELREVVNGVAHAIKTVAPQSTAGSAWLRVTAEFNGTQAAVKLQRLDTMLFLNANGGWQAASTNAIEQIVTAKVSGLVGVGRLSGNYGVAYLDDFSATPIETPPPAEPPLSNPQTSNPPTNPPSAPASGSIRKFDHIRIAQLAYGGQTVSAVDKLLLKDTVDLVVSNPNFLNTFETASAATPKMIYSNVSNIYEGMLTSWLDYADRTGNDREAAFYHVAGATPFTGSSSSSMPVTWFWNAVKTNSAGMITNVTAKTRGTSSGGIVPGAGTTVAFGSIDEFREINVTLSKSASSGFTGVWEYASAADNNGKITAWKPLPLIVDGTNGLRQSGRITFNPPVDWQTGKINADRLNYVRFRTTAATNSNSPTISRILGRDYVNANGNSSGVIPVFDKLADSNNDGYLNDEEYATRRNGYNARFLSESRLFYPYYGQMRFVVNPTFSAVSQWEGEYHADFLATKPHADGLFLDNQNGKLPFDTPVVEATIGYTDDAANLVAAIKTAIGNRSIIVNTSGAMTGNAPNGVTREAGIAFEEFLLRPTTVNWSMVNDVASVVSKRLAASPTAEVILDSHPGSSSMLDARTRIGVLSYYYLLSDPNRTYLMFFGGYSPTSAWQNRWVPAAAVDVGNPQGAMTTFASGSDPANSQLQYKVYGREYGNALVLFKPLSYAIGKGTGTTANATATTHQLNGNYRVLRADGSLGPVVTTITLRNGEGAVLMKT